MRFKNELERNITIKLGYANAKLYKCSNPACPRPMCYRAYGSSKEDSPLCERRECGGRMKLMRYEGLYAQSTYAHTQVGWLGAKEGGGGTLEREEDESSF